MDDNGVPSSPAMPSTSGGSVQTPLVLGTPNAQPQLTGASPSTPQLDIERSFDPPTPTTPNDYDMEEEPYNDGGPEGGLGGPEGGMGEGEGMELVDGGGGFEHEAENVELWGTNIKIRDCVARFRDFLTSFRLNSDYEENAFYLDEFSRIRGTDRFILNLNAAHLTDYANTRVFYQQVKVYPSELIPIIDAVVNEEYTRRYPDHDDEAPRIQTRIYNLKEVERMRHLEPSHIDQLLCLKGMVVRCSPVIPDLRQAFFRCFTCAATVEEQLDRNHIEEPDTCPQCQKKGSMELIHNRCLFSDKQLIRLQETPDEIPEGETPCTVNLFSYDDLVDNVRPGDRIEVTGILKAMPRRYNAKQRALRAVYKTYIDAVHFRRVSMSSSGEAVVQQQTQEQQQQQASQTQSQVQQNDGISAMDGDRVETFSDERVKEFEAFAALNDGRDVVQRLVTNFAPSIWEMEDVKLGVLCQLFGGTMQGTREQLRKEALKKRQQDFAEGLGLLGDDGEAEQEALAKEMEDEAENCDNGSSVKMHRRGDINILLCGDPGTSKSQLLGYVHKLSNRGIYTSGKGSSAVGLTASVIRDPETREQVLESGALVLSDNGICCIDEFDKMSDMTRAILHEAMEQQTVSITKAGIIATLNARTSILASANPVESRYNARLSVIDNIKLPPTLLSRFDLIFLILDKPNDDSDRRLARHLVSLYHTDNANSAASTMKVDQTFLRDYILYARTQRAPDIDDAAEELLVQGYLDMRSLGSGGRGGGSKTITATPRQLESLIRISQSLAKMRLETRVTEDDVREAIRLMRVATQTAATDPRTGTIDMDMITTGRSAMDRDTVMQLAAAVRSALQGYKGQRVTVGQLLNTMSRDSQVPITMGELEEAIKEVLEDDDCPMRYVEDTRTIIVHG